MSTMPTNAPQGASPFQLKVRDLLSDVWLLQSDLREPQSQTNYDLLEALSDAGLALLENGVT